MRTGDNAKREHVDSELRRLTDAAIPLGGRELKPENNMTAVHPGEILNNDLKVMGLDAVSFADNLGVHFCELEKLLSGERDLDAELALRLDRYFGSGARMWMNLQVTYSLKVAERDCGGTIQNEVTPRRSESITADSDASLVGAA